MFLLISPIGGKSVLLDVNSLGGSFEGVVNVGEVS